MLKQRLVGTAVLVGLAVIFVPMVLDGPVERVPEPQSAGIPLPLPEPGGDGEVPAVSTPTPVPAVHSSVPQPPPPAAQGGARWAVQLGSFSAEDNADALAAQVRTRGFDAFVQRVDVSTGVMFRVRVGPTADREAATALAARVERATGERAVVVPHP